jgi:4'-phosphopantetheinyl transferase
MPIRPLLPDEVHLWTVQLAAAHEPNRFWTLLSPDEKDRASRFRRDRDWVRFVICRGALRILAGRYLNCDPAGLQFSYGPKGKPTLGHSGLEFNVSHSHECAVYGFSAGPLGVDVEHIREVEVEAISQRFFAPDECTWILNSDARAEVFFDCWTRKEAYIKAEGGGLSIPLEDFSVLQPLPWEFYAWRPLPGYVAAAAVKPGKSFLHWSFEAK